MKPLKGLLSRIPLSPQNEGSMRALRFYKGAIDIGVLVRVSQETLSGLGALGFREALQKE